MSLIVILLIIIAAELLLADLVLLRIADNTCKPEQVPEN